MQRDINNRLPMEKIREICRDIEAKTGEKTCWVGGSQSPKSTHYPTAKSDVDFFVFPSDFDAKDKLAWNKYAEKTANLDLKDISTKHNREISLTFLPKGAHTQYPDLMLVR